MIKLIFTIALIAGGVFAFNVLEQIHEENPEILAQLDQVWGEVTSGNFSGASSNTVSPGRDVRGSGPVSVAASRPNTFGYAARSTARPDFGGRRPAPNINSLPERYRRNQTNDLATAYKQWRQAVEHHQKVMRASRNGGQGPEVRAALQRVFDTKFRLDTLKRQAHQARR